MARLLVAIAVALSLSSPTPRASFQAPQACGECRTDMECEELCEPECLPEEGKAIGVNGTCVECRGDDQDPAACYQD
jgi:hypothetical protein